MLMGALIGAVLGVIGAGVGWFLARLFVTDDDPPRWPAALGAVLALALTLPILGFLNKPTPESVLAQIEEEQHFFVGLKQNYPSVYSQVQNEVKLNYENPDLLKTKLREIVFPVIFSELPKSDEKDLLEFVSLGRDQATALARLRPDMCTDWLTGRTNDLEKVLPADLVEREMALYDSLLSKPPRAPQPEASDTEVITFVQGAAPGLAAGLGLSVEQFGLALQQQGDPGTQCRASAALMDSLYNADPAFRTRLIRKVFANAAS